MAEQPKEIRNRIRSVGSTKKITRTMELVATSKMKRAQDRVNAAVPYMAKLRELLTEVAASGSAEGEPLLQKRDQIKRVRVLLITANRGLCGGYNANVIRALRNFVKEQQDQGREVKVDVLGKKGISTLKWQGYELNTANPNMPDRPGYDDALAAIEPMRDDFLSGEVDEVYVCYTHWKSIATQVPTVQKLLPVESPEGADATGGADYIFDPEPKLLMSKLLPMYLAQSMYTCLVEAIAGEHVARRTAMKSATDNASDMITSLTRTLNRARQAAITQEIAEIVSGADSLDG